MKNNQRFNRPALHRAGLSILALLVGAAGASAQTMGSVVSGFNVLGNTQVTLTGFSPAQTLNVNVVGTSPGTSLTLTNAQVGTYHSNNTTSINGQAEGQILWNSLTAPAGASTVVMADPMPPALTATGGTTIFQAASDITNSNTATTVTGSASSIVIFRIPGALSLTNHNIILAGGILPANVYWQVGTGLTVINNDATNRSFPGTALNRTAAQNIAVTSSGAGSLGIGRIVSLGGGVSITQSGAGILTVETPAGGGSAIPNVCGSGKDYIYPSPANTATAQFAFCMERPGRVRIRVYNAVGDIAAKVEEDKAVGPATAPLNTARLAPGVYLYYIDKDYGSGPIARGGVKKFVVVH